MTTIINVRSADNSFEVALREEEVTTWVLWLA